MASSSRLMKTPSLTGSSSGDRQNGLTKGTKDEESSTATASPSQEKPVGDQKQKINTWFLDPSFSPSSSASQQSSSSSFSSDNQIRQPVFTPYNASTTTSTSNSNSSTTPIHHLPTNTPTQLHPIHSFLTCSTAEAADVIQLPTVQIFDTTLLNEYLEKRGEGSILDDVDGKERGGNWDWVITAVVKGRGRGVVARADGVIRRWLLKHPLSPSIEPTKLAYPKTPRISPDSDWSIIPLDLGSHAESDGVRACVNLLSEEGRERWKLEELWNARG
ncbi:hypothetical protein IAT40_005657 [Kwoniella sp. CBS 6097]